MARKIRYFNRFTSQNQITKATLSEDFFDEWFSKLMSTPLNLRYNIFVMHSSCIYHLLTHKDCPLRYRILYASAPTWQARYAALLFGPSKYRFSEMSLDDKSKTIRDNFILNLLIDLDKVSSPPKEILNPLFKYLKPKILTFKESKKNIDDLSRNEKMLISALRIASNDGVCGLVHPESLIRGISHWIISNNLEEQIKEFIAWENSLPGFKFADFSNFHKRMY